MGETMIKTFAGFTQRCEWHRQCRQV